MSSSKDSAARIPTSLFSPDAYYFAPNTNPASSRNKRPSTSNSNSTSTSIMSDNDNGNANTDVNANAGFNSVASARSSTTHARAPSAGKSSSFTRSVVSGNDPLKTQPKPKQRPSSPVSPSTSPIDVPPAPQVQSEPSLEPEKRPSEHSQSTMSHKSPFILKMNKRHHAHPPSRAPYPRSYDTAAIDHDTSTHIFFKTLCNSLTWHEFPAPPDNVLDLGCGTGVWILDAAKQWPASHFTGLDLVPLQPNVKLVAPHLKDRIKWVTANFLEKLDFPADHFDFIHIRRIARGVPEDKWSSLLEEVSRILKPDGAIEVIEEDLIFPGGQEHCTCHYPPEKVPVNRLSVHNHGRQELQDQLNAHGEVHHSPPDTPMPMLVSGPGQDDNDIFHPSQYYYSSHHFDIRDHSRLEQAYNDMHSAKFINLMPISVLTSILGQYFKDVRSHPPLLITFPPPEEEMWSDSSESAFSSAEGSRVEGAKGGGEFKSRPSTAGSTTQSFGSSAISTSAGGSPMRFHQPLSALSPISPASTTSTDDSLFSLSSRSEDTDIANSTYMSHPPVGGWHTLHLDVRSLVYPKQPFIMIDRCRMPARAFVPSTNSVAHNVTRSPNSTFELDLQSLTLHLSQSVTEVLECREAIWDFLVEQKRARVKKGTVLVGASAALSTTTISSTGSTTSNNMVDREEFDHWIAKYEREMRERIGMASALRKRFDWKTKGLSSSDGGNNRDGGNRRVIASRSGNPASGLKNHGGQTIGMAPLPKNQSSSDVLGDHHEDEHPYSASSTSLLVEEVATGGDTIANAGAASISTFRPRTGSAPERVNTGVHHKGDGHSRAHSMDAKNAWEALLSGNGVGAGQGQGQEELEEEEEVELPRLSRCVRVFVAWNNKGEEGI